MQLKEFYHVIAAIIILTVVAGFYPAYSKDWNLVILAFVFSVIVILVSIYSKKIMAYMLDADVEHSIWKVSRYGYKPHQHIAEIPGGIIFPLFLSLFSLGFFKFSAILTYETKALRHRAAKRFGYYSFTEMTEWHNALVGTAGIVSMLILAIIAYFANLEYLSKIAIYYAFSNMIPVSNLDGTQIYFGSKILYTTMAIIVIIFMLYALILV